MKNPNSIKAAIERRERKIILLMDEIKLLKVDLSSDKAEARKVKVAAKRKKQ